MARYTHRVAISNSRLLSLADGKVRFSWKDYKTGCQQREMTLDALEFLRRFLLHVLPKRFVRIRHYGFLAHRVRKASLALARDLLGASAPTEVQEAQGPNQDSDAPPCPFCQTGRMRIVESIAAVRERRLAITATFFDTS